MNDLPQKLLDEDWNLQREKLEGAVLVAVKHLMQHAGACEITLRGEEHTVNIRPLVPERKN